MDTIGVTLLKHENHAVKGPNGTGAQRLHLAIISCSDQVLLTLIARDRKALDAQIAAYVEQNAVDKLWPEDASRVLALIADQRSGDAVDSYFEHVGSRWDRESLHREVIEIE